MNKLPKKIDVAAHRVARAAQAKRRTVEFVVKNSAKFTIEDVVKRCMDHDIKIYAALDDWIRLGGK